MLFFIRRAIDYVTGPRLYRTYRVGHEEGKIYLPNMVESCSDNVIRSLSFFVNVGFYTSPIIIAVLGKRSHISFDGLISFTKFIAAVGVILISSLWIRGMGRYYNADYRIFLNDLSAIHSNLTRDNKRLLMRYDFDFGNWPIEWRMRDLQGDAKPHMYVDRSKPNASTMQRIKHLPGFVIGYIAAHTFGKFLVYPGSIGFLQYAMGSMLLQGRTRLIEEFGAERVKLETVNQKIVDIMVVDRRKSGHYPYKNVLVICTEGNAGFYETGIMTTPLEAGYSVIGWNHPGFGGSTGVPFPKQETEAIDTVLQYAIHQLKYDPSDIVLFAWSIGGYSASWAAMNYPELKSVILDATFDDLIPLAIAKMPPSMKLLIIRTLRDHMNLDNAEQLCKYPGPVLLVRRTRDEMITTSEVPDLQSNRGNDLLMKFLNYRFPRLLDDHVKNVLQSWLVADKIQRDSLLALYQVDQDYCTKVIGTFFKANPHLYPCIFGEGLKPEEKIRLTLFLANITMIDYNSTHCTPLPKQLFKLPWDPSQDTGFIKIDRDETSPESFEKIGFAGSD